MTLLHALLLLLLDAAVVAGVCAYAGRVPYRALVALGIGGASAVLLALFLMARVGGADPALAALLGFGELVMLLGGTLGAASGADSESERSRAHFRRFGIPVAGGQPLPPRSALLNLRSFAVGAGIGLVPLVALLLLLLMTSSPYIH